MTTPKVESFGCRLNTFEGEIMRSHMLATGLSNAIVFNTCAVTSEAGRQARQAIRKARRANPDADIIVTGCGAQTDAKTFVAMPEVTRIVGNEEKLRQETWQPDAAHPRVDVSDIMQVKALSLPMVDGLSGRTRAFVQVQNGCDHRCTFCIIPFGRGNSRSVSAAQAVAQIRHVVAEGHAEVVLSGVDLTSWGTDLADTPRLGSLIRTILESVPELKRLRLSSIDSIEADDELIEVLTGDARVMPHLHLSLQSGDNLILKRMKRRHQREDAIAICQKLRKLRPDIVFGADLIAGFPTETDEMFQNSERLLDECDLTFLHIFPFSPRPGTPAARMPLVDQKIVKERAARLRAAADARLATFLARQTGTVQPVLVEKENVGRNPQFATVVLGENATPGTIVNAKITGATNTNLLGRVV
jgi:threonylcarbamoyladenosine tRNA methylthiotransferase MtaB